MNPQHAQRIAALFLQGQSLAFIAEDSGYALEAVEDVIRQGMASLIKSAQAHAKDVAQPIRDDRPEKPPRDRKVFTDEEGNPI